MTELENDAQKYVDAAVKLSLTATSVLNPEVVTLWQAMVRKYGLAASNQAVTNNEQWQEHLAKNMEPDELEAYNTIISNVQKAFEEMDSDDTEVLLNPTKPDSFYPQ